MALIITHATVASDPQVPLLDHTDWNANHTLSGSVAWGEITGPLSDQTDLQTALDAKAAGAASSSNNAIVRFDGTDGKTLQDSGILITDANEMTLPLVASPATPATDQVNLYGGKTANKMFASYIDPTAAIHNLQASFANKKMRIYNPPSGSSSVVGVLGWSGATVTGFTVTSRNMAATNFFTRCSKQGFVTAATAGSVGQWRMAGEGYTVGNSSTRLGGFYYVKRFGISDAAAVSDARMFIGLKVTSTPTNVEPSTLINGIGMGHGAADTTMKIFYGGTSAQTPIDLGANFPADTRSTDMYELALYSAENSGDISYQVTRLNTGHVASGTITNSGAAVLPTNSVLLTPWGYRTNNATALAVAIDINTVYAETEF